MSNNRINEMMQSAEAVQRAYAGEQLRLSPFHPRLQHYNIRNAWSSWNGYKFADHFYDPEFEYFCIRNSCGTYDISPMQKYLISGSQALLYLNRLVTRDVTKLKPRRVTYVCWCTDSGRVIDDGTIFRVSDDTYMLTCGSPCIAWLTRSAIGFNQVNINDVSDKLAALSLQGPTSCEVLKRLGLAEIEQLRPFAITYYDINGEQDGLMISRTGFTGDLGYELWVKPEHALFLWDAIYQAGEDYNIHPYGEAATNMARLEAGFIMPYFEFNEALKTINYQYDQSPYELNLGWLVDLKKPHFNGRQALLAEKTQGSPYTLVKLEIEGNKAAEEATLYSSKKCVREIGFITSAMWSPVVKSNIALAMIESQFVNGPIWAEIYYKKELRQHFKIVQCSIKDKPFWAPDRAKATPPARF
jgi:aminomethyltransferase